MLEHVHYIYILIYQHVSKQWPRFVGKYRSMQQFGVGGSMFRSTSWHQRWFALALAKARNILLGMLGHTVADKNFYW